MLRYLLICIVLLTGSKFQAQELNIKTFLSWMDHSTYSTVIKHFQQYDYKINFEKDSLNLHFVDLFLPKTPNGTEPHARIFLSDSSTQLISVEVFSHPEQRQIEAQLKTLRFKTLDARIDGNFITTTFDNGHFLIEQKYEAVDHPLEDGQIVHFRYRIFAKYGRFDELNGTKTFTADYLGKPYTAVVENYRNGFLDGERIVYYPSGNVQRKEHYQNGRLAGLLSEYDEKGNLQHSANYSYNWHYGPEKWYDTNGHVTGSLNWQRDIPTGSEKRIFEGITILEIPYQKGLRNGAALVPVYAQPNSDTLLTQPIGLEQVNFSQNEKSGSAVCLEFEKKDTLYTAYYRNGMLDSIFRYYRNGTPWYETTFKQNLEEGIRRYIIPNGPLKDSVYRTETYQNGLLHGFSKQFFIEEQKNWAPCSKSAYYQQGEQDGYYYFTTENHQESGHFNRNQKDGHWLIRDYSDDSETVHEGNYARNLKEGKWLDRYGDSLSIESVYHEGNLNGIRNFYQNGVCIQTDSLADNRLLKTAFLKENGNFHAFELDSCQNETARLKYRYQIADTTWSYRFQFKYAPNAKTDTLLQKIAQYFLLHPESLSNQERTLLKTTPEYREQASFSSSNRKGEIRITHYQTGIVETIYPDYAYNSNRTYQIEKGKVYSGTFYSAFEQAQITVLNGKRNGWTIYYDANHKVIKRVKYKGGIAKKVVDKKS